MSTRGKYIKINQIQEVRGLEYVSADQVVLNNAFFVLNNRRLKGQREAIYQNRISLDELIKLVSSGSEDTGTFGEFLGVIPFTNETSDGFSYVSGFAFDGDNFFVPSGGYSAIGNKLLFSGGSQINLIINNDAITVTTNLHTLSGQNSTNDTLSTINGGIYGMLLILCPASDSQTITVTETGNIKLSSSGNFAMDNTEDTITLIYVGGEWREIARSNNGI